MYTQVCYGTEGQYWNVWQQYGHRQSKHTYQPAQAKTYAYVRVMEEGLYKV